MTKNIIFIDPFASKYKLDLEYYHGFVNALKAHHRVHIVNNIMIPNIQQLIAKYGKPDIIIFGMAVSKQGYIQGFYDKTISGLAELNIPKICFVLCHEHIETKIEWMLRHKITHVFSEYHRCREVFDGSGLEVHRLLFATTNDVVPISKTKQYHICFMGALHEPAHNGNEYNIRRKAIDIVGGMNLKTNILVNKRMSIKDYYKTIGNSKIWLCTTSIPDGTISPRFYELAKGKCLIFCEEWDNTYDGVFEDKVNCIMFKKDMSDFKEKLMYYLTYNDERNAIIERAYEDTMNKHLWSHRVEEVFKIIGL